MPLSSIYDFYTTKEKDNVLLSYKGVVTPALLTSSLEIIEAKLNETEPQKKIRKKVFNILVECLQNLYHHTEKFDFDVDTLSAENSNSCILLVYTHQERYFIKTGNYIYTKKVDTLTRELNALNEMTKTELRTHYIQTLNDGKRNKQGTAGLGMIDVLRKSGNDLKFEFKTITENISFFCLKVSIG